MTTIFVSASSLSDFNVCPKKYHYRTTQPNTAKFNDDILFGSIIHAAIEKYNTFTEAKEYALTAWEDLTVYSKRKPPKSIDNLLAGYFNVIVPALNLNAETKKLVEHYFRIPYKDDIILVGKVDFILNDCIYDWKTSVNKPSDCELYATQFAVYYIAYTYLFKRPPEKIFYGHLYSGQLIEVPIFDSIIINTKLLIDKMVMSIKLGLVQERVLGYFCRGCFYKDICFEELRNESNCKSVY
jgi:CRISPR/Cas system-associated exonuclease Cas4 (RecB family)